MVNGSLGNNLKSVALKRVKSRVNVCWKCRSCWKTSKESLDCHLKGSVTFVHFQMFVSITPCKLVFLIIILNSFCLLHILKVIYQPTDGTSGPYVWVINDSSTLMANICGLRKFVSYNLQLLAFTSVGDGLGMILTVTNLVTVQM
jgi:hypothetical protein